MNQRGVTLLELMLVIGIISIIMTVSTLPYGLIDRYRIRSVHNSIESMMMLARTQALLTQKPVRIEPLVGQDWASGLHLLNVNQQELFVLVWSDKRLHIQWVGTQPYILFHPDIHHAMCNGHVHVQIGDITDDTLIMNRICKLRTSR